MYGNMYRLLYMCECLHSPVSVVYLLAVYTLYTYRLEIISSFGAMLATVCISHRLLSAMLTTTIFTPIAMQTYNC